MDRWFREGRQANREEIGRALVIGVCAQCRYMQWRGGRGRAWGSRISKIAPARWPRQIKTTNMCTARGARTDVHRKRALRGARAEAAHDGAVRNAFSDRTIVCRLAGGGWGLCCRCTSLVLLHPVWGIAGSLLSLFEFSIQMTGGRTRTSRTHARGRSPVQPRARRSGEAEPGSDGWSL